MTDFSQFTYPRLPLTRAKLTVRGIDYYEWTSVSVRWAVQETPAIRFRFTSSEQMPLGAKWPLLQIVPPDPVTITLDGEQVCDGFVTTRQVYYSATEHQIELQGVNWASKLNQGPAQSQTGEFKNQPVPAIASALAAPYGVGVATLGDVLMSPIERFQIQAGETAWESVERLSRMVGAHLTSDTGRNLILAGSGAALGAAEIREGVNILEGREVIHTLMGGDEYQIASQAPGNDQRSMADAAQIFAKAAGFDGGLGIMQQGMPSRSLAELPAFSLELAQSRAGHEANIGFNNLIQVQATLVGWQKPGGGLWRPLDIVTVYSPMLVMDGFQLTCKAVEFTQDDHGGTRATIELVNSLGGGAQWQLPAANAPSGP